MFTWICPKCGKDVPPSYEECPNCGAKEADAQVTEEVPAAPAAPVVPPAAVPPPARAAASAPPAVERRSEPGKASSGLPQWALTLLFAAAFVAIGAGLYTFFRSRPEAASQQPAGQQAGAQNPFETPPAASAQTVKEHPYARFLEITGLRLIEEGRKPFVQFVVVNHSGAEIPDFAGTVQLRPSTAQPGDAAVGSFSFKMGALGPYESRDLRTPLETKLRVYELPDWQFLRPELQITSK